MSPFDQVWDFVSSSLVHNRTYAHRLPPTFIEQARGFANYRENAIYSDSAMGGIGNSMRLLLRCSGCVIDPGSKLRAARRSAQS